MKSSTIIAGVAMTAFGCKAPSATDAAPIGDSRDAATDAMDARAWSCSIAPVPLPIRTARPVGVVFDEQLPTLPSDVDSIAVHRAGDNVLAFTPKAVHTVTLEGVVSATVPYDPTTDAQLHSLSVGAGGFGGIFTTIEASTFVTRFCMLDGNGAFSGARCMTLGDSFLEQPVSAFDGAAFHVYQMRGAILHRWDFDSGPSLLAELDIPVGQPSGRVVAASAQAAEFAIGYGLHVRGVACGTVNVYSETDAGWTTLDLLPGDLGADFAVAALDVNTDGDGAAFLDALCLKQDTNECEATSLTKVSFILTFQDGIATGSPIAVPLPSHGPPVVIVDEPMVVLVYMTSPHDMEVSKFTRVGTVDLSEVRLPLQYDAPGNEILTISSGRAIAPNDYVVVYTLSGDSGPQKRIARFSL